MVPLTAAVRISNPLRTFCAQLSDTFSNPPRAAPESQWATHHDLALNVRRPEHLRRSQHLGCGDFSRTSERRSIVNVVQISIWFLWSYG
jgi:hypothetical protein